MSGAPRPQAPSLAGRRMNVVQTASNGVVNAATVFEFEQDGDAVWAPYRGGGIERGFLVGKRRGDQLTFRYAQLATDGTLDGGQSECVIDTLEDGRVRLVEHFEWESRPGGGTNVFEELPD